jgi:Protein of unknown function (DUF3300)
MSARLVAVVVGVLFAAVFGAAKVCAQGPPAAPQGQAAPEAQTALQPTTEQLDQLLAPIALYPDDLLSDILMAATYPLDVVEAARWLRDPHNALLNGDRLQAALESQDWDPSVKSLVPFPSILRTMDEELDWTERLGEAFLADQEGVMDAVQRLRQRAQSAGRLVSFPEATVTTEEQIISIEPSTLDLVYIPVCDPSVVYGEWPYPSLPPDNLPVDSDGATVVGLGCRWLSAPIVAPLWGWSHVRWRRHDIDIDRDRFAALNGDRPPIQGGGWGYDPSHRRSVRYRDPGVRARFGGATPAQEARPMTHGIPTFPAPRVSAARPPGPTLSRAPATERSEPSVKTRPATIEPFGGRANMRIQTEIGISRRTFAPRVDARKLQPSGGASPATRTTTRKQ